MLLYPVIKCVYEQYKLVCSIRSRALWRQVIHGEHTHQR